MFEVDVFAMNLSIIFLSCVWSIHRRPAWSRGGTPKKKMEESSRSNSVGSRDFILKLQTMRARNFLEVKRCYEWSRDGGYRTGMTRRIVETILDTRGTARGDGQFPGWSRIARDCYVKRRIPFSDHRCATPRDHSHDPVAFRGSYCSVHVDALA